MRRYLYSGTVPVNQLPKQEFDVVVVGSGVAGLYAALNLGEEKKVAILTKSDLKTSSSWQAQGGIAAVLTEEDDFRRHMEDTMTAGAGLCKEEAVRVLVEEGPENIHVLEEWEVPFDYNESGRLILGREGGHRLRRIAHCDGDATGRETTKRLGQLIEAKKNVIPFFRHCMIDIVTDEDGVCGVIVYDENLRRYHYFASPNVIVATGGIGQLYTHTTNPRGAMGDGIAAAHRAGAGVASLGATAAGNAFVGIVQNLRRRVPTLGIVAPSTAQGTAFEKHHGTDTGSILQSAAGNIENHSHSVTSIQGAGDEFALHHGV